MQAIDSETDRVFLAPGEYVDSDHPAIQAEAERLTAGVGDEAERAAEIFRFAREIYYQAAPFEDLASYRASHVLAIGHGYCGAKASLFAALCRAAGLPARLGFADVTNHLAGARIRALMGTEVFAWHGYAEVRVEGRWLRVSPTFNASLCARMGVPVLEFDGRSDALHQAYDGSQVMRYERYHGLFHDVPARFFAAELPRLYPETCAAVREGRFKPPPKSEKGASRGGGAKGLGS